MRIWFLTSEYPPYFGGGIGTYTYNAARAMVEAGHEVLVVTLGEKEQWELEKFQNNWWVGRLKKIGDEKVDPTRYWQKISHEFKKTVLELLTLNRVRPDLIEVQDYNGVGYDLLKEKIVKKNSFLQDIPIGVFIHAPTFELAVINQANLAASFNQLMTKREKACLLMADGLMTPSQFLKNLIEARMKSTQITIMPCPYFNDREKKELPMIRKKRQKYLMVGRLECRKGVMPLVLAMVKRWEAGSEEILTMVGEDTFFEPSGLTIKTMIEEIAKKWLKKGKLVIKDKMPPEELTKERAKADAIIVPSLYESFSYVTAETIAEGRAVIANRSGGGPAEIIGEQSQGGWLFDWEIEGSFDLCLDNFENLSVREVERRVKYGQKKVLKMTNPKNFAVKKTKFATEIKDRILKKENLTQIKRMVQVITAFEQGLRIRRRLKKLVGRAKVLTN